MKLCHDPSAAWPGAHKSRERKCRATPVGMTGIRSFAQTRGSKRGSSLRRLRSELRRTFWEPQKHTVEPGGCGLQAARSQSCAAWGCGDIVGGPGGCDGLSKGLLAVDL